MIVRGGVLVRNIKFMLVVFCVLLLLGQSIPMLGGTGIYPTDEPVNLDGTDAVEPIIIDGVLHAWSEDLGEFVPYCQCRLKLTRF